MRFREPKYWKMTFNITKIKKITLYQNFGEQFMVSDFIGLRIAASNQADGNASNRCRDRQSFTACPDP